MTALTLAGFRDLERGLPGNHGLSFTGWNPQLRERGKPKADPSWLLAWLAPSPDPMFWW